MELSRRINNWYDTSADFSLSTSNALKENNRDIDTVLKTKGLELLLRQRFFISFCDKMSVLLNSTGWVLYESVISIVSCNGIF